MASSSGSTNESSEVIRDFPNSSPNLQKCPLCRQLKTAFYCKECVRDGQIFGTDRAKKGLDKKKLLLETENKKKKVEQSCLVILHNKLKRDILTAKTCRAKERNKILMKVVEEKQQNILENKQKLAELKERNEKREKNLPKYEQKVQELENLVADKREKTLERYKTLGDKQNIIRRLVKLRIQQLFKYIFPIAEVMPVQESESSDDMVCALAEASQTTYIRDRWEYTDFFGEQQFSIVAPTLPRSGNYSAYNIWVSQGLESGIGSSNLAVDHNPAFTISAALTYTAQLLNIMSYYLNVRLPHKMLFSDFCSNDMSEDQFLRRVARLNANVLYLCFSQNVNPRSLRSHETIHNVLQLTYDREADLGRQGPIEIPEDDVDTLEQPLENDLRKSDTSDSEECDSFPLEWEAVPHIQCTDVATVGAVAQPPQMFATQQATSMTGGLVNSAAASIASLWRGFTRR